MFTSSTRFILLSILTGFICCIPSGLSANDEIPTPTPHIEQSTGAVIENNSPPGSTVSNTINQQNLVIFSSPTPKPAPPPPGPAIVPNEHIDIRITDDRTVVHPGEAVTYRISFRNFLPEDLTNVRITLHVPQYLIPLSTTPEAYPDIATRTITWGGQTISAESEVTFALEAQVQPDAPDGVVLRVPIEVNGPGVRAGAEDLSVVEGEVTATVAGVATQDYPPAIYQAPQAAPVPVTAQTGSSFVFPSIITLLAGTIASFTYRAW